MKTLVVAPLISFLAAGPTLVTAQPLRDAVPLRHWPAPLYWQPDLARPLTTPTEPNPLTFMTHPDADQR